MVADDISFRVQASNPSIEEFNRQVEQLQAAEPRAHEMPVQATRAAMEASTLILLKDVVQERTLPGPAGEIPLRVFIPDKIQGVYLHLHGGGFTLGRAHHQDPLLWDLARSAKVVVVSVDYRLAPENPYPAGPDDCEAVACWLIENAEREFGANKLLIGGESAGANLAVVTLLRLRDKHGDTGFVGANLSYGAYDLSLTPSVRRWGDRFLVLSRPLIEWLIDCYVPPDRRCEPDVSPLYANLLQMPPALFTIGTPDPLLDDSLFMFECWRAADNWAELAVYPGGIHGLTLIDYELGHQANVRIHSFIVGCAKR